jgi:hypothetical protein
MKRFVAGLVLVAACRPLAFAVDPTFVPSEHDEIARAADDWNARTVSSKRITFDGSSWRILKRAPDSGYNGYTDGRAHIIQISPESGRDGAGFYAVSLHEFGHALGLNHTTTGVMMPFTVSVEFTPEVMAECRRAGACP